MLLDSKLPDKLWNNAEQTAAYIRNWCYSTRTKKTPYEMLTGTKPNMSKIQKFGFMCFAYNTKEKGKWIQNVCFLQFGAKNDCIDGAQGPLRTRHWQIPSSA